MSVGGSRLSRAIAVTPVVEAAVDRVTTGDGTDDTYNKRQIRCAENPKITNITGARSGLPYFDQQQ